MTNKCKQNNVCPKCGSDAWDWANIGFSNIVQCTHCGNVYVNGVKDAKVKALEPLGDRWPFPTINKPLKPLTPKEVKQYNKQQVQDLGESPL